MENISMKKHEKLIEYAMLLEVYLELEKSKMITNEEFRKTKKSLDKMYKIKELMNE